MRTAIVSAILAGIPLFCFAGDDPKPKPSQEQAVQQEPAAQPVVQSPKATIPTGLPMAEQPIKSALPSTPGNDPLRMAAPLPPEGVKTVTPSSAKSYVIG